MDPESDRRILENIEKLKNAGWVDDERNPENYMIFIKKCSSCGKEFETEYFTKTAFLSEETIDKIIEKVKIPKKCRDCIKK